MIFYFFKYLKNNNKNLLLENNYNDLKKNKKNFLKITMYPWFFITKSSVIHQNNIFFGVTNIHNDINYYVQITHFTLKPYFSDNYIYDYKPNNNSLSKKKNRVNCIHSAYFVYNKLLNINYPYLNEFEETIYNLINWNIKLDPNNRLKIFDYAKEYGFVKIYFNKFLNKIDPFIKIYCQKRKKFGLKI